QAAGRAGEEEQAYTSIGADAELDQVIYDGSSFGTATFAGSDEEADYLGLPGLLNAEQMRDLLRKRQAEQVEERSSAASGGAAHNTGMTPPPPSARAGEDTRKVLTELRRELNTLVGL